jgi:hypothetical protein
LNLIGLPPSTKQFLMTSNKSSQFTFSEAVILPPLQTWILLDFLHQQNKFWQQNNSLSPKLWSYLPIANNPGEEEELQPENIYCIKKNGSRWLVLFSTRIFYYLCSWIRLVTYVTTLFDNLSDRIRFTTYVKL